MHRGTHVVTALTPIVAAIDNYLTHFSWDEAKYPYRSSLKELTDKIHQQVAKLDDELKVKAADYNNISHTIAAEERKLGYAFSHFCVWMLIFFFPCSGNLLVKSLADTVKPTDITDTDYLTTLLIVVPKYVLPPRFVICTALLNWLNAPYEPVLMKFCRYLYKDWYANYESLTQYILPRSTKQLAEDTEYGLFSVILFKRVVEEFKNMAREKRFTVRDFKLDEVRDSYL